MSTAGSVPGLWSGRDFGEIVDPDALAPFLMSVVSASDAWMFLSSRGALTAGRRSPKSALFPYTTDDKLHDAAGQSGPITRVRVRQGDGSWALWRPFDPRGAERYRIHRRLLKTTTCDAVLFEEVNEDLGLTIHASWEASERYGWIRRVELTRQAEGAVALEVLDGLVNLMPAEADLGMQSNLSTLLDAYRMAELVPEVGIGLMRLSSIPLDEPRPNESLRATAVYSLGLDGPALLSTAQLEAFEARGEVTEERLIRGRRGAYLRHAAMTLDGGASSRWLFAADVERDGAAVLELVRQLADPAGLEAAIEADLDQGRQNLSALVGSADGLQRTDSQAEDARHFANTLFNIMRGGVFLEGGRFDAAEFARHVRRVAPKVADECAELLGSLSGQLDRPTLLERLGPDAHGDLARLAGEYLPLTFGRRHGDPSRPWNTFTIPGRDDNGDRALGYEGNWRDIFQNWEALCLSFPSYGDACVSRFLNSSTADGYNPYRIDMSGVDWEVDDPDDPWAFIGYWGDHQVVYLARLVEMAERFSPGGLGARLETGGFVFVDVPYRIAGFDAILRNPHETVTFDNERASEIDRRIAEIGNEGQLLQGPNGERIRATLAEKLLTPLLVKLTNLVPGGGIWMNTQRPEWNDANNAIAGLGLSIVTTAYLHSALGTWIRLFSQAESDLAMTAPLAELLDDLEGVFGAEPPAADMDAATRLQWTERLGRAGERHRSSVYAGRGAEPAQGASSKRIVALLEAARRWTGATLDSNERSDGLFHSYNLMQRVDGGLELRRLALMLEGQVAVLAAGLLDAERTVHLVGALRKSPLFREDQHSYILYPDRDLDGFLERGLIPAETAARSTSLGQLLAHGGGGVVVRAHDGSVRFAPDLHYHADVSAALDDCGMELDEAARSEILAAYEQVFDHEAFPGRSMTFFAYEGLGSVYWHMVSKLVLATQDVVWDAPADQRDALLAAYRDLRDGLGTHKSPEVYGAFPSDPYSHTPAGGGARQPGLTGQVKEDVLARLAECGIHVTGGQLGFRAGLTGFVTPLAADGKMGYFDAAGTAATLQVPAGSAALTYCCVPILLRQADGPRIKATYAGGASEEWATDTLDAGLSSEIFRRTGKVRLLEVWVASA